MYELKEIVKRINDGQCVAFVGSGPSCEMGVPSWEELARRVFDEVKRECPKAELKTYADYINKKNFAELFSAATHDLPQGYPQLISLMKEWIVPRDQEGKIYKLLAKWPFAFYLTTNYDNLLYEATQKTGVYHLNLSNTPEDFKKISAELRNAVINVHGHFEDPENLVLTAEQYEAFKADPGREYFRKKLESIFSMFPVIFIGYSLQDPDIDLPLSVSKYSAAPDRPIFAFLANVSNTEVRRWYTTKNIRIISYKDTTGEHEGLLHFLQLVDRFIVPKQQRVHAVIPIHSREEEYDVAASLYIFTHTRLEEPAGNFAEHIYKNATLWVLHKAGRPIAIDEISNLFSERFPFRPDLYLLMEGVDALRKDNLIASDEDDRLQLTPKGRNYIDENSARASALLDQFVGQIQIDFAQRFPESDEDEKSQFADAIRHAIVSALDKRGLALASTIFGDQVPERIEQVELLDVLQEVAAGFPSREHQIFFLEYALELLVNPSPIAKEFIALHSQGYFAYHSLGLDPSCSRIRLDWLKETVWIFDSSVILPLVAKGCENHKYAKDLFSKIKEYGLHVFTTEKIFSEVIEHARWAKSFVDQFNTMSMEFLLAALGRAGYKQNLFIDGFIKSFVQNPTLTFDDYYLECFGMIPRSREDYIEAVGHILEQYGVEWRRLREWPGFNEIDWGELPDLTEKIKQDRVSRGTYRSDLQCEAEAEVLLILMQERKGQYGILEENKPSRAYFVTQSPVLRRVVQGQECPVCTPEAFYRLLLLFPNVSEMDTESVYQSLVYSFYELGIPIIDEEIYAKYFHPLTTESKLSLHKVSEKFKIASGSFLAEISKNYEEVPDLEKPLFSIQAAWIMAERAEEQAKQAKQVARLSRKEREELERLRVEKKLRKERARRKKRKIQAKKRKKRKKKKR